MTWEGQGWRSAARDYHANREAAQGQELPFRFVLPRDITLQPKAFLIDGFVGAAETSAWYVAASQLSYSMPAAMSLQVSTTAAGR